MREIHKLRCSEGLIQRYGEIAGLSNSQAIATIPSLKANADAYPSVGELQIQTK